VTYGNLKYLVKALLIGDNVLTKDDAELLVLLAYAFAKVANYSDALKLFTTSNVDDQILRSGPGRMFVRKPELPEMDIDELDIDDELSYPVARFICSFVSREKGGIHVAEAMNLIRLYNAKVEVFFENMAQDGELQKYDSEDVYGKRKYPETSYVAG